MSDFTKVFMHFNEKKMDKQRRKKARTRREDEHI